ncbi:MAG: S8 family serine peptidase, partial [Bacteroidetes bacterium]|nr:S8 family serine peptidase [Bacteroidota bacterium]
TVFFNLAAEAAEPLNGRPHFRLRIKNTNTALKVVMQVTAPSGTVHCWNVTELDNDVGNWGQAFQGGQPGWTAGDAQYGIGEPGCTESAITAAACQSTTWSSGGTVITGGIAGFSSFGPTLDGRIKPDITAPGLSIASSINSFTDNSYSPILQVPFQGRNYPFARLSGTSMATPAVAGTAALLLEAVPALTAAGVRSIIRNTALTDNKTGTIPPGGSTRWGMGKLNAYHAITEALGITGVGTTDGPRMGLWPNPADGTFWISPPLTGTVQLTVTDVLARTVLTGTRAGDAPIMVDASAWPTGVYVVRVEQNGQQLMRKVVKE